MTKKITKICKDYVPSDLDCLLDDSCQMTRLYSCEEVREILKQYQSKVIKLIAEEISLANKNGESTSRLTSLSNKI
jgi:hypothetical protein